MVTGVGGYNVYCTFMAARDKVHELWAATADQPGGRGGVSLSLQLCIMYCILVAERV